jgi:hypothetical protein
VKPELVLLRKHAPETAETQQPAGMIDIISRKEARP